MHYEVGDACEIIKKYPGPFDVVFIDIDKHAYPQALELARSRVRVGGYIICDNALWSRQRARRAGVKQDADTRGVVRYNKDASAAPRICSPPSCRCATASRYRSRSAPDKRKR